MKVLILTTKYPSPNESEWLISELANELAKRGNSVKVLNVEWSSYQPRHKHRTMNPKVISYNAISIPLGRFSIFPKWIFSSLKIAPYLILDFIKKERYDLLITTSPCTACASAIVLSHLVSKKSLLIYWDFFPIHNQQISNKVPVLLMPMLKNIEKKLVNSFSDVACMSPANLVFFDKYFDLNPKQNRFILPIWTSYLRLEKSIKKPLFESSIYEDNIIVTFGGQLVEGRGLETLIEAIKIARVSNNKIKLVVCGDGQLSSIVEDFCREEPLACSYLGKLPREEYLNVLSYSDIGVVATIENVDSPTYPSKSLDYMAASIPIVASVEKNSDFGLVLEENNFGLSCDAGNPETLAKLLIILAEDAELRYAMGRNGLKFLNDFHSVSKIVNRILEI